MADIPDNLSFSIEDIFAKRLQLETGEIAKDISVVQRWQRPYSEIFLIQYHVQGSVRFIVAKRLVKNATNSIYYDTENPTTTEFETLKFLKDKLALIPNVEVPNPRLIDAEENCYFMDFVDGEELESLMNHLRFFAPRSSLLQLSQVFFQAGKWLKCFQKLTGVDYGELPELESIVTHCEHRLKLIEKSQLDECPADLRSTVLRQIEELLGRVRHPIPISGCHGDFGPWNMIVRGEQLTVIDFFTFRREVIAMDATNILVTLDNQCVAPSYSESRVAELVNHFMEGYHPEFELEPAVLELIELHYRVCSVHGSLMKEPRNFRDRIRTTRILKRSLKWIRHPNRRSLVWDRFLSGVIN